MSNALHGKYEPRNMKIQYGVCGRYMPIKNGCTHVSLLGQNWVLILGVIGGLVVLGVVGWVSHTAYKCYSIKHQSTASIVDNRSQGPPSRLNSYETSVLGMST